MVSDSIFNALDPEGYLIVPRIMSSSQVVETCEAVESLLLACPSAGVRGLANKVPYIRSLAESPTVRALVEPVLGPHARLIRSVLFNKSQEVNWQVAWHQDLTIAVQSQSEVQGFVGWSVKEGVVHVQPPVAILEQMLTVRLHLDPTDETNGALWVSPGSHRFGRLPSQAAAEVADRQGKIMCAVQAGDALVFRPLLLHASRKAVSDSPRRVVHLEFTRAILPEPLAWHEAV